MAEISYPPRHHPVFFLIDALTALGADAQFARDERTRGCWGMKVNGKIVVYLIDNRHPHEAAHEDPAAAELLQAGALVMCAQQPDAERVGAKWLPLAVTPGYRTPETPVAKLWDVGFVGYVRDAGRMDVLRHVIRRFTLCAHQGVFGDDAVSVYWQSRVGLNVPTGYGAPTSYDTANMRCFEVLATGTPLVTAYEPYLNDLGLADGATCLTYRDADELIRQIDKALANPAWAAQIGRDGAALAQARHTYQQRAQQVLEWLA